VTADETHDDFADRVDTESECWLEFVCTDHECEHYKKAILVKCSTEQGLTSVVDDHDLTCSCGAERIQAVLVGAEQVDPKLIERYKQVGV
jgi:hypothetical protein